MSTLILILQVLGFAVAALAALWAYAYWHQTTALKAEMERLCAAKPGHWKPGEPNPVRGIEYCRRNDGSFEATPVPYPTPTLHEQARDVWQCAQDPRGCYRVRCQLGNECKAGQ